MKWLGFLSRIALLLVCLYGSYLVSIEHRITVACQKETANLEAQIEKEAGLQSTSIVLKKMRSDSDTVVLTQERAIWNLAVDKVSLFRGEDKREWNISLPWKHRLGGRSQPTKSEVLLHAVGSVRLTIDEEYDPVKHSFGLKIWLVPLSQ